MDRIECVVIGAGLVGLAVARELALAGRDVLILEAGTAIAAETSARNSGVIHAGLYYTPGSMKARCCVEGRRELYAFCERRGVPFRRCGKLVVATTPADEAALEAIAARAEANGVEGLERLDAAAVHRLEPEIAATAALHSTVTGIVDPHALALALLGEAEDHGAVLVKASRVVCAGVRGPAGIELDVAGPDGATSRITATRVVNAAGLHAAALASRIEGLEPAFVPPIRFARGHYFALDRRAPFSRLVYPVPEPGGLGVHLTLDLAGAARFGPDVEWLPDTDPATLTYGVDAARAGPFAAAIRRWWPGLPADALVPAYAGIRPKLAGQGAAEGDFRIDDARVHGLPGLVNLFGIESPGLTACLALAREVRRRLLATG